MPVTWKYWRIRNLQESPRHNDALSIISIENSINRDFIFQSINHERSNKRRISLTLKHRNDYQDLFVPLYTTEDHEYFKVRWMFLIVKKFLLFSSRAWFNFEWRTFCHQIFLSALGKAGLKFNGVGRWIGGDVQPEQYTQLHKHTEEGKRMCTTFQSMSR